MRTQESKDNNKRAAPQGFEMSVMRGRGFGGHVRGIRAVAVQWPRKEQLTICVPCDPQDDQSH